MGHASKPDLPKVWVRPVNPEEYPGFSQRPVKPVTREDLGNAFHTVALRAFPYDKSPTEPGHRFRVVNLRETLDLWTRDYPFGQVIWPMWPFLYAENWREVVGELARRQLYLFDIWAYCPSGPFERFEWSEYRVPDEVHQVLLSKLGPRFLGYDNGEQDGRYVGGYAKLVCPAPATREQGYQAFCKYFEQLGNDLQNALVSLNSLTFPHYFARMGNHRLIGTESAQALPSVPMWYAFVRGAGKQYGVLWFGNASVWNRWGAKSLADPNVEDSNAPGFWTGPTAGTSMSLLRRLWTVLVMYGGVIMGYESGHLGNAQEERLKGGKKKTVPVLTDIGKEHLRGARWCQEHPDRGEMHAPVALLWDFYAGWVPPRHLYTPDTFLVWGNMPYEKGDHQIDLMLRELYPRYQDAGFYHNEQGFLTDTPAGDSFDVILSDARPEILDRYACVVVLGETRIEGDLLRRLAGFVERGGALVASANQLGPDACPLFGVTLGPVEEAYHAIVPGHPWPINEPRFRLHRLWCDADLEILAATRQGAPLAARRTHPDGGQTTVFAAEFGLSNPLVSLDKIASEVDQPLSSPYALLEHVKALLLPHLRTFCLVTVEGPPIQFLVNVTKEAARLVVTLCNNSPEPWSGTMRPKRGWILRATNWMTGERFDPGESVRIRVPPLDVVVVEMNLNEPVFEANGTS